MASIDPIIATITLVIGLIYIIFKFAGSFSIIFSL